MKIGYVDYAGDFLSIRTTDELIEAIHESQNTFARNYILINVKLERSSNQRNEKVNSQSLSSTSSHNGK